MHTRGLWQLFALPGVLWLLLFFVVPFYAIMAVAFGAVNPVFEIRILCGIRSNGTIPTHFGR